MKVCFTAVLQFTAMQQIKSKNKTKHSNYIHDDVKTSTHFPHQRLHLTWTSTEAFDALLAKLLSKCDSAVYLTKWKSKHLKVCEMSYHFRGYWILCVLSWGTHYPRPVLAFGYCRCPCLCISQCVCINHLLVRTITHQPFKIESPNLKHRCKTPWLRSLLFLGVIDLDLQVQI